MATLVLVAAVNFAVTEGVIAAGMAASAAMAAAAVAGGFIDSKLFSPSKNAGDANSGSPKLESLRVTSSTEGQHIPRVYGRYRIGAQVIWSTNFEEEVNNNKAGGGKGGMIGGGGSSGSTEQQTTYNYYANFAIGLCEGKIDGIGRVWLDGKETSLGTVDSTGATLVSTIDRIFGQLSGSTAGGFYSPGSMFNYRVYFGTEDQQPDSFIEALEGVGKAPAYRGLSYIVFEHLPLEKFGNRIPQINIEVFRRPSPYWDTAPLDSTPDDLSLSRIIQTLFYDYGFTQYTLPTISGEMYGYAITNNATLRDAMQPLLSIGLLDTLESGGMIKVIPRDYTSPSVEIDQSELLDPNGASRGRDGSDIGNLYQPLLEAKWGQESDLPLVHVLRYQNKDQAYTINTVVSRRRLVNSNRVVESSSPTVIPDHQAQRTCDITLQQAWVERENISAALMPSFLDVEPTDIIKINDFLGTGTDRMMRVGSVNEGYARKIEGVRVFDGVYSDVSTISDKALQLPYTFGMYTVSNVIFMQLPLLTDTSTEHVIYTAGYQTPWPGSIIGYRSKFSTEGFIVDFAHAARSKIGAIRNADTQLKTPITKDCLWDYGSFVTVDMTNATLTSSSDNIVFGGENLCAVKKANGSWELIAFGNAELISAGRYKLTKLLRGQRGTDDNISSSIDYANSDNFVFLNGYLGQTSFSIGDMFTQFYYSFGPAGAAFGGPLFTNSNLNYTGRTIKPYSPADISILRDTTNYIISWKRRTRIGGDSWELSEVPLSETTESYTVNIYNGTTVVRTFTTTATTVNYSRADCVTDFGADVLSLKIEVIQNAGAIIGISMLGTVPLTRVV